MKYGVLILCVLLVACGGATGQVIDDGKSALEEQVAKLESAIEAKDELLATKDSWVANASDTLDKLRAEVAAKQNLIDQQKIILKDLDNERMNALAEAERCEELEEKNQKLQDMLDICQEDLS